MFKYARSDTHFLLYIYDNLRNELIDRSNPANPHLNHIENVLTRSKETSLLTYEPDIYDEVSGANPTGWSSMLKKSPAIFTDEQLSVFKAVHRWRDKTARQADESLNYVMPKRILFNIARIMPANVQSLLSLSRDMPPLVKLRASEIVRVIKQARGDAGKTSFQALSHEIPRPGNVPPRLSGTTVPLRGPGEHDQIRSLGDTWAPEATTIANVFRGQTGSGTIHAKTDVSRFWGSAFGSSLWHPAERASSVNERIHLALPLPQLTAEIFKGGLDAEQDLSVADPGLRAEHQYVKKRKHTDSEEDNIIIIKQLGGGRKRKLDEAEIPSATVSAAGNKSEAGEPTGTADYDVDGTEARALVALQERKDAKSERRRLRKAEKKRRKMEQEGQSDRRAQGGGRVGDDPMVGGVESDQKPFDYTTAPSVLRGTAEVPARSDTRKAFNPYAKSGDSSKGMRKSRKEVPGKSITFKR
jgi:exosome complex exonuclease RRP6